MLLVFIWTDVEREGAQETGEERGKKRARERKGGSEKERERETRGERERERARERMGVTITSCDIVIRVDYSIFLISLLNGICTIMKKPLPIHWSVASSNLIC